MNASSRWQEIISENLAASQVPGYKRQDISFESVAAGLVPVPTSANPNYVMPRPSVSTDFTPAGLRTTSVETDMAIDGAGFFTIQLPSGDVAYTRDGEFHRSPGGQLVTKEGYQVLGETGPIELDSNNPKIFVSPSGEILQGSDSRGKLRIVNFDNPNLLTPIGAGHFLAKDAALKPEDVALPVVRQGFLEMANTNTVSEMTHLITSLRMFEMNQRVVQSQDERLGRTISELSGNS